MSLRIVFDLAHEYHLRLHCLPPVARTWRQRNNAAVPTKWNRSTRCFVRCSVGILFGFFMDLQSFLYGFARVPIWLDVAFSVDLQVLLNFRYGFANVSLRSCMALSMEFQGLLMD